MVINVNFNYRYKQETIYNRKMVDNKSHILLILLQLQWRLDFVNTHQPFLQ